MREDRGLTLKTLKEKARKNKEIEKLYGAAHFYFWNQNGLSESNVNWPKLSEKINSPLFSHIKELIQKYGNHCLFLSLESKNRKSVWRGFGEKSS